jgi:hypothetical protein
VAEHRHVFKTIKESRVEPKPDGGPSGEFWDRIPADVIAEVWDMYQDESWCQEDDLEELDRGDDEASRPPIPGFEDADSEDLD